MFLLLSAAVVSTAQAGAWVHAPDSAWAQFGYALSQASQTYDESGTLTSMADEHFLGTLGDVFSEGAYQGHELAAYIEYGIQPDLEVFGRLPIRVPTSTWTFSQGDNPNIHLYNWGLGDLYGGIRSGVQRDQGQAASAAAALRLPLYNNSGSALNMEPGNMDFYDDQVPLGEGTIDLEVLGAAGTPLGIASGWLQAEVGVRLRNRGYATAFPATAQLGVTPTPGVSLMANGEGLWTLNNGQAATTYLDEYGKGPLIIDGQRWVKAGGGLLIGPFGVWGLSHPTWSQMGLHIDYRTVLWGQRTASATSFSAALTWQR